MSLVFGWNSFRQKSYEPHELGLAPQPGIAYTIELRQKYFHLFWIPFFPIGKKWCIRQGSKLFELPIEEEERLKNTQSIPAPWYTYIGTILVVGGLVVFFIVEKLE
jgi:hypothetical protein